MLVLHLVADSPSYGNRLIERVGDLTGGAVAVNPNTMYPLLRSLEAQGLLTGIGSIPSAARSTMRSPGRARGARPADRRAGPGWTASRTSIEAIRAEIMRPVP